MKTTKLKWKWDGPDQSCRSGNRSASVDWMAAPCRLTVSRFVKISKTDWDMLPDWKRSWTYSERGRAAAKRAAEKWILKGIKR